MKKTLLTVLTLCLAVTVMASVFEIKAAVPASDPTAKIDIYTEHWTGNPIPGKVFRISPALPNGALSVISGNTFARIYVSDNCSTNPSAPPCFRKNVWYTVDGGDCFNRLRIRFNSAYALGNEPNALFSELFDGNEGFQISGGTNFTFSLLPMRSPYPCG
jgi:hypothetical protein